MRKMIYIGFTIIFIIHTNHGIKFEDSSCLSTIKSDGISVVNHGITLLNPSIKISGRFFEALQDLYNMDKNIALPTISNSLNKINQYAVADFKLFKDVNLDKAVLYTYTDFTYMVVNKILDEHNCGKKNLTEKDKTLAPLTAYLMAVMLYSPELPKEKNLTAVMIELKDINLYKVGTTFLWSSFGSSNEYDKMFTRGVTIVVNNAWESIWSPRRIEKYSYYPEDKEVLYPPGALFRVREKRWWRRQIYLYADLISE